MKFNSGDFLRVKPADGDDPMAQAFAGRRCKFLQYVTGALFPTCVVMLSTKGKPITFREKDLEKSE